MSTTAVRLRRVFALLICLLPAASSPQDNAAAGKVPVPPMFDGGLGALWEQDAKFIETTYGPFELLTRSDSLYAGRSDTLKSGRWNLVAMGNFLNQSLQYATVARLRNNPSGILLVMFEWVPPTDSTRSHGVFYHALLATRRAALRTKQGATASTIDTLEYSCSDLKRVCGACFLDARSQRIAQTVVGKD